MRQRFRLAVAALGRTPRLVPGMRGAALLAALALAACASPAAPAAPAPAGGSGAAAPAAAPPTDTPAPPPREAVRIPYSALSVSMLPHFLAYDAGLYEREGLDVTMDYVATSTVLTPAMLSGEVAFADSSPEAVMAADLQGGDLVVVGGGLDRALYWLMGAPGQGGGDALRGKRVGITRFGSISDTVARAYIPTIGLEPDRDVTILQLGGYPEIVGALQSGALDAGVISPPNVFQARQNGAVELADLTKLDMPLYQSALVSSRHLLAERPDLARRVLRAYAGGWRLLGDEGLGVAALKRWTRESDDQIALDTYRVGAPRFPETPIPSAEPLRRGLESLAAKEPAARGATAEQFVAPELMTEIWGQMP